MTPLERSHESRIVALEEAKGEMMAELGSVGAKLDYITELLEERPSRVEFAQQQARLESVRAKARSVMPSNFELEGPGGLKAKLSGFSGVTLLAVFVTVVAGALAWLVLR